MSEDKKHPTSRRLNKLMYAISLLIGCLALFSGIVSFLLGLNNLGYYHFATVIIYIYCAYLSKNGRTYYSRILFFILLNLGITSTASFIGRAGSVEYMFIFSLALPFSVFSFRTEKLYVYFFSLLSGFLWITLAITDFKLFTDTPIDIVIANTYIYPISIICAFTMVVTQLIYFSILGTKYYSKIHIKKQEALEASLAKSKFLSTMSHEIRTPLNAVIGLSHILGDNEPREDQIKNIEALSYSGKTLLNLLNNVLDFSKMQFSAIELDNIPTNINADAQQIKKIHEAACLKKGILLKLEIDDTIPYVYLDIIRFSQVLNNLISNAIKFTDKGSVTLIIKKIRQRKDFVTLHVEVKDTGIGIPKVKQKIIWEAFTQESNTTNRLYGGTGLGLPIVKSILNVMKTKARIRSVNDQGSRFYFNLKLKIAKYNTIEKEIEAEKFNFTGIKVLLVDDNLINVMVGKQILEKEKLIVSIANDGLIAVQKVKEENFDIVLMDIQMPIMDGYKATKEIRKFNPNIPILALSANVFMEVKDKIDKCGMNGFIFKPFTPEDLLSQIEKFTRN
ncbi:response regulator [Polaribacter glomeratus]|uniref:histidine kinase n=1 Tax=Polaribacter glomeratus TaxID=102 RepID=A0A2S7WXB9_9FLAO|nr:response regulator [Polaribacter glomeratus]PQJ82249.1 two-component system sensor histidine kinase/response regulator [Polaribacter glomeratus]TXD66844.1 response regulator [Polaribacter glomeratus]